MKKVKLPKSDLVQKLGGFWDTHDLTDLEGELKEVARPVFIRHAAATTAIEVWLGRREAGRREVSRGDRDFARTLGLEVEF